MRLSATVVLMERGESGLPNRRYFNKGKDERTHHVHVFQLGSMHIIRHLAFRDYLNNFPQAAKLYSDLKISLAKLRNFQQI